MAEGQAPESTERRAVDPPAAGGDGLADDGASGPMPIAAVSVTIPIEWLERAVSAAAWKLRRHRDDPICQDVVQETIVEVLKHLPELRKLPKEKAIAYVGKIAISKAIAYYRERKRRREIDESNGADPDGQPRIGEFPSPAEYAENEELLPILATCREKLTETEQALIEARFVDGLSWGAAAAVAEIIGMDPANLAKQKVNRAIDKLRKCMERKPLSN